MIPSRLLRSSLGRLLIFGVGALVSIQLGIIAAAHVPGWLGISRPFVFMGIASAVIAVLVLSLSVFMLQREGASVSALGLPTNRRRIHELAVGFMITALLFQLVACAQAMMVDARWHFQGWSGVVGAGSAFAFTAFMVVAEELVFRGVGFRYLRGAVGDWLAVVLSAVVFGGYHLIGSQNWGVGLVLQFLTPMAGGLLFGWAAVRTGGLSLPIGLHWGGNWIQAGIAGFSPVAEPTASQTLWHIPISASDFRFLMAPDLLPRAPYFAAIAIGAVFIGVFLRASAKPFYNGVRNC